MIANALKSVGSKLTKPYVQKVELVKSRLDQITLPERFKGTIVERWTNYWKGLLTDYSEVIVGVGREARAKPRKAAFYAGLGFSIYYCSKHNPDEEDLQEKLKFYNQEISLVAEPLQNPTSKNHLLYMERCYNKGLVRRLNLGVLSLIWIDNFNPEVNIYRATSSYLKPDWLRFHERIIDVGFLDRFWNLNGKMVDYDINM